MSKNITELGPKEAEFISLFSTRNSGFFGINEATKFWKNKKLTYDLLSRLERKGWIERIEKGKYLVIPLEAGPRRKWSSDTYLIASEMVSPASIGYWSAIRHWNWTEQIPRIVYVQTTKRKSNPKPIVLGVKYEFVTVNKRKFFGHIKEWRSGKPILITDREKTLIDCADDVERAGSIEELIKAVKSSSIEISWVKLHDYASIFPNGAVKKRLGFLFETFVQNLNPEAKNILDKWQRSLTAGVVPLQPSKKKDGKINTRWKILDNTGIK